MAIPASRPGFDLDLSVSPYLPTVPLEGSERVIGLNELQRLLRQAPLDEAEDSSHFPANCRWRARDSLFQAPLSTLSDKLNKRRDWISFWHSTIDTELSQAYSIPGSVPALCQRIDCNISEFVVRYPSSCAFKWSDYGSPELNKVVMQHCYWALWKWTALIWMYLMPKAFLGLLSCVASYFLVLWFTGVSRRWVRDLRLTRLPAPVAGLFLKRNVFLAFVVQLCIVSVVGWRAISSMFAWLISSTMLLLLHAALRRPSWHLNLIATASTAKRTSQPDWGWLWGDQPELVTYFGYFAMFSDSATPIPTEGLRGLIDDCRKRLARFVRRRSKYLQGWLSDVDYALRFEWYYWCEAIQQRRARRRVLRSLAKQNRKRRFIPWGRKRWASGNAGGDPCHLDGGIYL